MRAVVEEWGGSDWYAWNVKESLRTSIRREVMEVSAIDNQLKTDVVRQRIFDKLTARYDNSPVQILSVDIGNIEFPKEVTDAIQAKIAKQQELERQEFVLAKTRKEAAIKVLEALKVAKQQRIISTTLDPLYVQRRAVEVYRLLAQAPNKTYLMLPTQDDGSMLPLVHSTGSSTNPGGISVNENEVYFVHIEFTNNSGSEMSIIQYVHELGASFWTTPSITTLTASTVINDVYLNSLITPVKAISDLDVSTNFGFNGIRTCQYQGQNDTYMRWRLNHRNRYLHVGARIYAEGVLRIYLDNQLIQTETKTTTTINDFVYLYDMNTIAGSLGITAPDIGEDYEIKFRFSQQNAEASPWIRANFVWELPTP